MTGKGGVGKSTFTAVLALLYAAAGRRTLVCELNARERVAPLLGHPPVGSEVSRVEDNLFAVDIVPDRALEEYALMKLRYRALYSLVFDNPMVRRFVRFVPGMNDLLTLGKAFNHQRELNPNGAPAWDAIIIDAPATGHGVSFFRLPKVIRDTVPAGNMHDEAAAMWDLLTDPALTAVHLVTLPEELPVQETRALHRMLGQELGMPLGWLVVNMMPQPLMSADALRAFETWPPPRGGDPLRPAWEAARVRLGREAQAARYSADLASLKMAQLHLPTLYSAAFQREQIERLAASVRQQIQPR